MLYKKTHRQYLREFKRGRKFKVNGNIYRVAKEKPYMKRSCIFGYCICIDSWILISISSGKLWHTDDIKLLED